MKTQKEPSKIVKSLKGQASLGLKFLSGVGIVFWMAGFVGTANEIAKQQYRIRNYVATEAKIIHSEVKRKSRKRYKPEVEYSYVVGGQEYISNEIAIINDHGDSRRRAEKITAEYRANKTTTAYFNPKNPQKSFLIYEVAFWPYGCAMTFLALLCLFVAMYFAIGKIYREPRTPMQVSESYFALHPETAQKTFKKTIVYCFFYYLIGIVLCLLYFSLADKPYQLFPQVVFGIYFLTGVIPIWYFGYNVWQCRGFQPPELSIDQPQLQRGREVKLKIAQKFKKAIERLDAEIELVCEAYYKDKDKRGYDRIRNEDKAVSKTVICKERFISAGEVLEFEDGILAPQAVQKSGFTKQDNNLPFFCRWYFKITNTPTHGAAYTVKYFVNVL